MSHWRIGARSLLGGVVVFGVSACTFSTAIITPDGIIAGMPKFRAWLQFSSSDPLTEEVVRERATELFLPGTSETVIVKSVPAGLEVDRRDTDGCIGAPPACAPLTIWSEATSAGCTGRAFALVFYFNENGLSEVSIYTGYAGCL